MMLQLAKEQAERRKTAQLMFELGQKAYGRGMYGRAIEFLEAALTIIPRPTLFGGEVGFVSTHPSMMMEILYSHVVVMGSNSILAILVSRYKYGLPWLTKPMTAMQIALPCTSN